MKKHTILFTGILSILILSCNKSSQQECERNSTGSILFHNDPNGFNPDSIRVFWDSIDLGIIRLSGQMNIDHQPTGKDTYTFTYRGITLYSDSVDVTKCNTSHYIIDISKDCSTGNTGIILFHNNSNGFNPDSISIYSDTTFLGMIRLNSVAILNNLHAGKNNFTFKYQGGDLYSDSIDVTQCHIADYSIDWNPVSDKRLKKNILSVNNALANIEALNIYSFEYNAPKNYAGYLSKGTHFGFIAQELKNVYPEFVRLNTNGYYSVNYMEMIPILAQGIKEQQTEIDDLKKEIAELKSMVKNQQAVAAK